MKGTDIFIKRLFAAILFAVLAVGCFSVTTFAFSYHEHDDGTEFVGWDNNFGLPIESGNYVLTNDVKMFDGDWVIQEGRTINICLEGHKINGLSNSITVEPGAELTFCDCTGEGEINGFLSGDEGILVQGTLTMKDVTLCEQMDAGTNMSSIVIGHGGTFKAINSFIENLKLNGASHENGVVIVDEGGTFDIYGGMIWHCCAPYGAVYVKEGGTLNLGGDFVIEGNYTGDGSETPRNVLLDSGDVLTFTDEVGSGASVGVSITEDYWGSSENGSVVITRDFGRYCTYGPEDVIKPDNSESDLSLNDDREVVLSIHKHILSLTADPSEPSRAILQCVNGSECDYHGTVELTGQDIDYDGSWHGVGCAKANDTYVILGPDLADELTYYDEFGDEITDYLVEGGCKKVKDPGIYTAKVPVRIHPDYCTTETGEVMEVVLEKTFRILKPVTVTFDPGLGSGSMDPVTAYENIPFTMPECTFTPPENMAFSAWKSDGDDPYEIWDGFDVYLYEDTLFTAQWYDTLPSFRTHELVLNGDIGVNFYMYLPEDEDTDFEDSYMEFTVSGKGGNTTIDPFDRYFRNAGYEYYGFTCTVNAIQMADTITAEFHYTDGEVEKTVSQTYSVKEYIGDYMTMAEQGEFDDYVASELVTEIVKALADYGHYAQVFLAAANNWAIGTDHAAMDTYFDTDGFTSDEMEDIIGAIAAKDATPVKTLNSDISKLSFSLILDSKTGVDVYITRASGYKGTITAIRDNGWPTEVKKVSSTRSKVSIPNIAAQYLDQIFTFEFTTENDTSPATVTFAPISYIQVYLQTQTDEDGKNAMAALYRYYEAAYKYSHSYVIG